MTLELEEHLVEICERHGWEWAIRASTGTEYTWDAELRITFTPGNPNGADRSVVTYVGGATMDDAFHRAWLGMAEWLVELNQLVREDVS